jgi:hypothetical protein
MLKTILALLTTPTISGLLAQYELAEGSYRGLICLIGILGFFSRCHRKK